MRKSLVLIAIVALSSKWAGVCHADQLSKYNGLIEAGREIELTERPLAALADKIKLRSFTPDILSEEDCKDYVLDEKAFRSLPPEVQKELSMGLSLEKPKIIPGHLPLPSGVTEPKGLVDSKGNPIHSNSATSTKTQSGIQSAENRIVVPKSTAQVPTISNWELVNANWNQLPLKRKAVLVQPEHLSRRVIAALALRNPEKVRFSHEINSLFKSGLEFHDDLEALELKDAKPYTDLHQLYSDTVEFSKKAGLLNSLTNPIQVGRHDSSLQIHASVKHLPENESLRDLAEEFSRYVTIKAASQGDFSLISDNGLTTYGGRITSKESPVRLFRSLDGLISNNRIEIRHFSGPLEDELNYFFKHMTNPNLRDAEEAVRADYRAMLTPSLVNRILGQARPDIAENLLKNTKYENLARAFENKDGLPIKAFQARVTEQAARVGIDPKSLENTNSGYQLGRLHSPDAVSPPEIEKTMRVILNTAKYEEVPQTVSNFIKKNRQALVDHPGARYLIIDRLQNDKNPRVRENSAIFFDWLKPSQHSESLSALISAMKDSNEAVRENAKFAVVHAAPLPEDSSSELEALLNNRDQSVRELAADAIYRIPTRQDSQIPKLIAALKDESGIVRNYTVATLGSFPKGHEAASMALLSAVDDPFSGIRSRAMESFSRIAPGAESLTGLLLEKVNNTNIEVRSFALSALSRIATRDKSIYEKLRALANDANAKDHEAAKAVMLNVRPPIKNPCLRALTKELGS